jgi:hypothetical protein
LNNAGNIALIGRYDQHFTKARTRKLRWRRRGSPHPAQMRKDVERALASVLAAWRQPRNV